MSLFRRKTDPFQERSRELNEEIHALQAQIRRLQQRTEPAVPASVSARDSLSRRPAHFERPAELVLEEVPASPLATTMAPVPAARTHHNELGVRKLDLSGWWERCTRQFRGPAAANPKLVSYLAAGSIQGLRPLRYEKRIARNRFIVAFLLLSACLWGLLAIILRQY